MTHGPRHLPSLSQLKVVPHWKMCVWILKFEKSNWSNGLCFFGGYLLEKVLESISKLARPYIWKCQACWRFSDLSRRISRFDPVGTTSGDVGTLLYRVSEDPKQDSATPGRCKSWQVTGISRKKFDSGYDVWVTRICNLCVYMYVWHAHLHRLSIKALWYDCSKMFNRGTGS